MDSVELDGATPGNLNTSTDEEEDVEKDQILDKPSGEKAGVLKDFYDNPIDLYELQANQKRVRASTKSLLWQIQCRRGCNIFLVLVSLFLMLVVSSF